MNEKGDAARTLSQHLYAAIERVREDVAEVEFWADAVSGFSKPVPDYEPSGVKVWLPSEQASTLEACNNDKTDDNVRGKTGN